MRLDPEHGSPVGTVLEATVCRSGPILASTLAWPSAISTS
jgi:hypothetical protein